MEKKQLVASMSSCLALAAIIVCGFSQSLNETAARNKKLTYASDIAPILNSHCVECHRPGEVAPFSLIGYENAKKWAGMMAAITQTKQMPPWRAVEGYGEFYDVNRLTKAEIDSIRAWSEAGSPRGDATKEPKPPTFANEWSLGEPDAVLTTARPFKIDAEGSDVYRNFVLKTSFPETRWVTAMDVKPGNTKIVHHVIAFVDEGSSAKKLEERNKDGQDGYTTFGGPGFIPANALGGWAPGLRARKTYPGTGFELKPGATIVMQVHYHKDGKPETDKTRLGIYFAKEPVTKNVKIAWVANPFIRIPAGDKEVKLTWSQPILVDATIFGAMPHMHLLGRSMKAKAVLPDGTEKPLVWVDDWDFNWQMNYAFKEPIFLPRGSKVVVNATYDNSATNRNNPNSPPKTITWGEQTTDEMFLLVVPYVQGRITK